jgi:hypothetical protein
MENHKCPICSFVAQNEDRLVQKHEVETHIQARHPDTQFGVRVIRPKTANLPQYEHVSVHDHYYLAEIHAIAINRDSTGSTATLVIRSVTQWEEL